MKILLIGGAEDRKDKKEILSKVLENSKNGVIGICPSALVDNPLESFNTYREIFNKMGARKIIEFDIRDSKEADYESNLDKLDEVDTIFFTGGDQVRLYDVFGRTKFLEKLKTKIEDNKIFYCGTSAGSAVAPEKIIYDGDYKGLIKGSVKISEGFGIIKNVLIDTHFFKRLRLERISQALLSGICTKGIGIAENGSILIIDNICQVIGKNCITFIDSSEIVDNKFNSLEEEDKISVVNLKVTMLNSGDKFDLEKWKPII
jgi:cyanophycinase